MVAKRAQCSVGKQRDGPAETLARAASATLLASLPTGRLTLGFALQTATLGRLAPLAQGNLLRLVHNAPKIARTTRVPLAPTHES